jgi:hypothetical protein
LHLAMSSGKLGLIFFSSEHCWQTNCRAPRSLVRFPRLLSGMVAVPD